MKKCTKCGMHKELSEYYKDMSKKDNLTCSCKECVLKSSYNYIQNNVVKRMKTTKAYQQRPEVKKRRREYAKKYALEKVAIKRVQARIRDHIKSGKLKRSGVCYCCNKECKTVAHHHDYTKPFSIMWLCNRCHTLYHQGKTESAKEVRIKIDNYVRTIL